MEVTTFIWMFLVLKIPLVAALWIIWMALKAPEPVAEPEDDGGSRRPDPHRGPTVPKPPRRGPHSGQPLPAPPRVRTLARGRTVTGADH